MSNLDVMTGLYDAFARGDVPAVLGVMHPEIHWHEAEGNPYMPSGEALVGPDAVLEGVFKRLAEEWDGFAVHPGTYHDAGDVVVVELRYSGTHKETGKSIDAQVCHVWTLQDGKVTKFQQYVDTAKMQDAMGAR
jgi:ketosteroid isomerase-like protein